MTARTRPRDVRWNVQTVETPAATLNSSGTARAMANRGSGRPCGPMAEERDQGDPAQDGQQPLHQRDGADEQ